MRIGIGLSLDADPRRAAAQATAEARKTVPRPKLAVAFGSVLQDQQEFHAGLCSQLDPSIVIGGSSYAEITNAGVTKKSAAVLLLDFDGPAPRFSGAAVGADPRKTGLALAKPHSRAKRGELPVALLFGTVGNGRDNDALKGIAEMLGPVPVFGGMCAGNYDLGMSHPEFWTNYQYSGPKLTKDAARLAVLDLPERSFKVGFGFEHGWEAVGPTITFTRAKGDRVYEIDGVPVFDYYRQFLGRHSSDEFFEKLIQRYGFSMHVGENGSSRNVVKLPVCCDFTDKSICLFPAEDLQGKRAQLIQSSRLGLIRGAKEAAKSCLKALGGVDPALLLVVSCCTRNAILHSKMDSEIDAIRSVFGRRVPVFGYYSGGEIVPFLSRYEDVIDTSRALAGSHYHATTVGLLAIGARKKPVAVAVPPEPCVKEEPARLRELLAKSEEILDNSESFMANLSRKSYRDGEALKKQNEIIYRYTPHDVYNQIGAAVSTGAYELFDAEFNGCFLFMDVKGFTGYSEQHGSKAVVKVLNEIFEPATEIIYECEGDVDKFIGDCIFAVFKKPERAVDAGKRILTLFAALKRRGNPFTVRIGINSGRAVRANVGSKDRREYTYIGDAVNLAQRLEANCTPGKLLLAESVFKKAAVDFSAAARREIIAKGKKEPVVAYECAP